MCWADKLTILWAGLLYLVVFIVADHPENILTLSTTYGFLILIAPVWFVCRGINWFVPHGR